MTLTSGLLVQVGVLKVNLKPKSQKMFMSMIGRALFEYGDDTHSLFSLIDDVIKVDRKTGGQRYKFSTKNL